jgi:hypothetical protein
VCATDQQPSEIAVTPFADPTQSCLAAGRVLSRHEPEPSSKLTTTVEHAWVWNRRRDRGCDDRPDPGDGGQAPADRIALVPDQNLRLERSDSPLDLVDLTGNRSAIVSPSSSIPPFAGERETLDLVELQQDLPPQ